MLNPMLDQVPLLRLKSKQSSSTACWCMGCPLAMDSGCGCCYVEVPILVMWVLVDLSEDPTHTHTHTHRFRLRALASLGRRLEMGPFFHNITLPFVFTGNGPLTSHEPLAQEELQYFFIFINPWKRPKPTNSPVCIKARYVLLSLP